MTTSDPILEALSRSMESILKEHNGLVSVPTLADYIKEVYVESNVEYEGLYYSVSSADVINCVEVYDKIFKFYKSNVGLKDGESAFWYYEILDILEKEKKPTDIENIFNQLLVKYKNKFGLSLEDNDNYNGAIGIIEDMLVAWNNKFTTEYKLIKTVPTLAKLKGNAMSAKEVLSKIGLTQWHSPSVTLADEVTEILNENNYEMLIDRLCYKINDRKKYYMDNFLNISEEQLEIMIKEYPDKFSLENNAVKLVKS